MGAYFSVNTVFAMDFSPFAYGLHFFGQICVPQDDRKTGQGVWPCMALF